MPDASTASVILSEVSRRFIARDTAEEPRAIPDRQNQPNFSATAPSAPPTLAASSPSRLNALGIFSVVLAAVTAAAATLYRFPPELYSFYPVCPIHQFLHIDCPGCGTTRALSALLHGHLVAAIHFNALTTLIGLPLAFAYAVICLKRSLNSSPFRWPAIPRTATVALISLSAAFTLFRNL